MLRTPEESWQKISHALIRRTLSTYLQGDIRRVLGKLSGDIEAKFAETEAEFGLHIEDDDKKFFYKEFRQMCAGRPALQP